MSIEHLRQDIILPIEQGDPVDLEVIAMTSEEGVPTAARFVVKEDFNSETSLVDSAGSIDEEPISPGKWRVVFHITEAETRGIDAVQWSRFAATITMDGQERTYAAGRIRCAVAELTTP